MSEGEADAIYLYTHKLRSTATTSFGAVLPNNSMNDGTPTPKP